MDREDEYFSPEDIDRQIDRLLNNATPPSPSQARLLKDLQDLHVEDEGRLEHIWERLSVQTRHNEQAHYKPLIDIQVYQQKKRHLAQTGQGKRQRRTARRIGVLLAELIAVLVIASVLVMPALFSNLTTAPNFTRQTQYDLLINDNQGIVNINTQTQQINWRYPIPNYNLVQPIISKGIIYVVSQDTIYAIDEVSGILHWSHTFSSQFAPFLPSREAAPVLVENTIYVALVAGLTNTEIDKLDANSGSILQTYQLPLDTPAVSIAVENNILYAMALHDISAIRLADGQLLWHQEEDQTMTLDTLHVLNGTLYTLASNNGSWPFIDPDNRSLIETFNASNGQFKWQTQQIQGNATDMTIDNGVIYDGATDGSLTLYDSQTGTTRQKWLIPGMSFSGTSAPIVVNHTVYLNTNVKYINLSTLMPYYQSSGIVALNINNGQQEWSYPATQAAMVQSGYMFGTLTVQNGVIYVDDLSGQPASKLYALMDGKVLWASNIDWS